MRCVTILRSTESRWLFVSTASSADSALLKTPSHVGATQWFLSRSHLFVVRLRNLLPLPAAMVRVCMVSLSVVLPRALLHQRSLPLHLLPTHSRHTGFLSSHLAVLRLLLAGKEATRTQHTCHLSWRRLPWKRRRRALVTTAPGKSLSEFHSFNLD